MATVSASGELAQGQMTSGLSPLDWKTLRNASQEDMDPTRNRVDMSPNGLTRLTGHQLGYTVTKQKLYIVIPTHLVR